MLPPEHEQQLHRLLRVFLEENQHLNLSAFRTEETCWIGNILDSLALLDILPHLKAHNSHLQALDIGTGGGFPLLPLAICLPAVASAKVGLPTFHFTGIDATRKKVDAVKRIICALGLPNVTMFWGRAEGLGKDPVHHKKYDIVFARAVAKLPELLVLSAPFLKLGGYAVFWKSLRIADELRLSEQVQKKLGFALVVDHRYTLPEEFGERQLLIFQKTPHTLHYPP